jgi:hypothetical protein
MTDTQTHGHQIFFLESWKRLSHEILLKSLTSTFIIFT